MRKLLASVILVAGVISSNFVNAQNPAAIDNPAGTTITVNPGGFTTTAICGIGGGDIIGEPNTSGTDGVIHRFTNASWPSAVNSPCLLYGIDYSLTDLLDANSAVPCPGAPADMADVTYNAGLSNLANGIAVFTGTTDYTYLNGVYITTVQNIRVTLTITQAGTATPMSLVDDGTRLYLPVSGDFDIRIWMEAQAPAAGGVNCALAHGYSGYHGTIELFDYLQTNPANTICTEFESNAPTTITPGYMRFYESTVTATASDNGPVPLGGPVNFTGGETASAVGPLTYDWTGPNNFPATQNPTIAAAVPGDAGLYTLTVTDLFGCTDTETTNLVVLVGPEIDVEGNATSITDGDVTPDVADDTDFGNVNISAVSQTNTFTINSVGTADLDLTGVPLVAISGSAEFTITLQPAVDPVPFGNSTTFEVTFTPTCANLGVPQTATISIASDDTDENPFTFDVTATGVDDINPTITCTSGIQNTSDDGTGDCTFTTFAAGQAGTYDINDNCSSSLTVFEQFTGALITTSTFSLAPGNGYTPVQTFPAGLTSVTVTVTDDFGNYSSCSYTTTIIDDEAPAAICQPITINLNAAGNASIVPADVDGGSTDNCSIAGLSVSPNNFTCAELGANIVTLTVLDNAGNSSTCNATVTVQDNAAPTAICQDITVQLDASGSATITGNDIDNNSTDNCYILSYTAVPNTFACIDVAAPVAVTLTVEDQSTNTANCISNVTVEDNVAPTALCANTTVTLDASGNGSIVVGDIDAGSTDACGVATTSASITAFDCSMTGINTVTLTVTDNNGNVATCDATVTVEDTENPVITCPATIVVNNDPGMCSANVTYAAPTATDNCGTAGVGTTTFNFTGSTQLFVVPAGVTSIHIEAFGAQGGQSEIGGTFGVIQAGRGGYAEGDLAVIPGQTLEIYVGGQGDTNTVAQGLAAGGWNGGGDGWGGWFGNWTMGNGTSGGGGGASDVRIAPYSLFERVIVAGGGGGSDTWSASRTGGNGGGLAGSNSGGGSGGGTQIAGGVSVGVATFGSFGFGANGYINPAEGHGTGGGGGYYGGGGGQHGGAGGGGGSSYLGGVTSGLTSSGLQSGDGIVNITWAAAPTVAIAQTDATGLTSGSNFPVGTTTLEYTATDPSGNTDVCTFDVTVTDNELPTMVCAPYTVQLDAFGIGSLTAADIDGGSTDNCGIATLTASQTSFTCGDIGTFNVTLTADDINGNSNTCLASVTVEDNIAPAVLCNDFTVSLDALGAGSITTNDIGGLTAVDACGIASVLASQTAFGCGNVGVNPITLTVTDVNSNVTNCIANVTVQDLVAPSAICQNITVALDAAGNYNLTAVEVNNGSNDACGVASLSISPSAFTCAEIGVNTVILTVTDVNGNSSTCTSDVTVEDQTPPVITCPGNISQSAIVNNCGRVITYTFGVVDACAVVAQTDGSGFTSGDLFPVGTTNQEYTITDQTGTYTCLFTVEVTDDQDPIITNCPSDITVSNDPAVCEAQVFWTEPIASDNCPGVIFGSPDSPGDIFPQGTTIVTYTAADASVNTVLCQFNITVNDTESPDITACTPDIVVSNYPTACGAIVTFAIPTYTENCAMGTEVADIASGSFFAVGTTPVTWTLTDLAGNISNCSFDVTVNDDEAPIAVCNNITVQLDAAGNATIVANDIDGGTSSDNCGVATTSVSPDVFDCSNVGANTVTLTVDDIHGNTSTCTATVTIEDNVAPVALCAIFTAQLDATGNVMIAGTDVDGGSSDACGIATYDVVPNAFNCANVGANPVTLTVTDVNGNSTSCVTTVTVEDNVNPVAVCQDITVQLDVTGNYLMADNEIDGGSSDACGIFSMVASQTAFNCSNVGPNSVTLTITDNNANTAVCTATVTVEDNVAPNAVCQDIIAVLDVAGDVSVTPLDINNGSSDACGIALYQINGTSSVDFGCSNVGVQVVTLSVEDNNGNVSTCTANIDVQDNTAPTMICQDVTVQLDATGNGSVTANDIDNGSSDACGLFSATLDITSFNCSNVGANSVTLTVTDVNGNSNTCTQTVTVEDNVAPTAVCQNIVIDLDATGNYSMAPSEIDGGSNDACGLIPLTASQTLFTCSDVTGGFGGITVTLTVEDVNGNVSTCDAIVAVHDVTAPVALCQDITVQLDATGNASIIGTDIDAGSTDACGIASLVPTPNTFTCAEVGANVVTLTVTDVHGNSSTCNSTVTVEDNVAPVALCQDVTVQLDAAGLGSINTGDIDVGSSDACGIASTSLDITNFNCASVAVSPVTVTLTVTDNNGNVSTCTASVTVEDNLAPIANCQDITVQLDATGNVAILDTDIDNVSTDNCAIATYAASQTAFDCSDVGANTVTLTLTDVNGNVSTCTSTVTVEDNVAPVALCQDVTVQLDAAGLGSIVPGDIDNGSSDACGLLPLTLDNQNFDCGMVGSNMVTLTVEDVNGNISTCTATVTVEDNIAPTAICQDISVALDATGNATIADTDIDNGSFDNCGIATYVASQTAFDCSNIGPNAVTLTLTDVNGNVSACLSTVTIIDNIAPILTCPGDVLVSNDPGLCTASAVAIGMAIATDNCAASVIITNNAPAVYPYGTTVVTWTGVDGSGNSATCNQNVTVEDVENPLISCPSDVTVDTDLGSCDATGVALGTPMTSDNCTVDVVSNDAPATFPLGGTNVTWTVTDVQGNSATCTQLVTVEDNEAPTIVCPSDVTVSTNPGICAAAGIALGTPTTDDNCTVASLTNNAPGIFLLGTTTVTWTVTDAAGNTAQCTQTVTVQDTENPLIACPIDVTVNNTPGICGATGVSLGVAITNDNCTVDVVSNDAPATFPLGDTDVTWTVTDLSGNSAQCTQVVTVVDNEVPTITCPSDVTVNADAASCSATGVALGTPATADNCSVSGTTNDAPVAFLLGNTTVTWTVTDGSGNTATCTQVVTVEDNEAPVVTCPSDFTVSANGGSCDATPVALGSPITTDNCTVASVSNNAPVVFPLGNTTVTWTVIDAAGNSSTCTQVVTVVDTEAPAIACPGDVIVSADAGSCDATGVALGSSVTSDNCTVDVVNNDAPAAFPLGTTTVTWTVTDLAGNSSTCTQVVTVEDNEAPAITCPVDVTVSADAGVCDATGVALGTEITSDNCSVASVSNDALVTFPLGTTTVTWTVIDGSGNTTTCTQLVNVVDTEAPAISCPSDMFISADLGVCGSTVVTLGAESTSDNCSVASVTNDGTGFYPVGTTTVTWTVTDGSGNTSTCTQDVTVTDDEAPVVTCDVAMTVNTDPGSCDATGVVLASPASTDNCLVDVVYNDAPAVFTQGTTTVTWTVVDPTGNTTQCTQDVTVIDIEAPVVSCPADIVMNNTSGFCGASVFYAVPTTSDNCGVNWMAQTDGTGYTAGNLYPIGTTVQEYTVTDNSGNTASCMFDVTVIDAEAPFLTGCPANMTVYTTKANQCEAKADWNEPQATDNCPGVTVTQDHWSGEYFGLGTSTVNYSATDFAGNTVSCSFTITVIDVVNPTISVSADGTTLTCANNADQYQWVDCDNGFAPIAGANGQSFTPTANGNYAVITSIADCNDTSGCENIAVVGLGDVVAEITELIVYPNPSMDGIFKIKYSGQITQIDVIDMLGRIISLPVNIEEKVVDGSELARGKYMIRVYTDLGIVTKEVVIVK